MRDFKVPITTIKSGYLNTMLGVRGIQKFVIRTVLSMAIKTTMIGDTSFGNVFLLAFWHYPKKIHKQI